MTENTNRRVLYRSSELSVEMSDRGPGSSVVFTFSSFTGSQNIIDYFGQGYLERRGFSVVFFAAAKSNWWQSPDMDAALAAALAATGHHGERISYGGSMGAYGALMFAGDLRVNRIVAFCPQVALSDTTLPLSQEWLPYIDQSKILRDDVGAGISANMDVRVCFDSFDAADVAHIQELERRLLEKEIPVRRYIVPFGTHKVLEYLRISGILSHIAEGMLNGQLSVADFRQAVRINRTNNTAYLSRAGIVINRRLQAGSGLLRAALASGRFSG